MARPPNYGVSCDSVEAAIAALGQPSMSSKQLVINLLERRALSARAQGVAVIARECLANRLPAKDASTIDVEWYCQFPDEAELKAVQLDSYLQVAAENGCTWRTSRSSSSAGS